MALFVNMNDVFIRNGYAVLKNERMDVDVMGRVLRILMRGLKQLHIIIKYNMFSNFQV